MTYIKKIIDEIEISRKSLIESYFSALAEAIDFVKSQVIGPLKAIHNPSDRELALLGTYYRIYLLATSLLELNHRSFFQTISNTARTMFELVVDLEFIVQDPHNDALAKYNAFPAVERFRSAQKLSTFLASNPGVQSHFTFDTTHISNFATAPGKQAEIEAEVKLVWGVDRNGNLLWPSHWTNVDLRSRARVVGVQYEAIYLELYPTLSWYSHSGPAGCAGLPEEFFESLCGISIDRSQKLFVIATKLCAREFHLDKAIQDFSKIIGFLEEAAKNYLQNEVLRKLKEKGISGGA